MSSLVVELQKAALDSDKPLPDVMRIAKVVARKLGIKDFEDWIDMELNGYTDPKKVPGYRVLRGQLKVHNPYHGWQTLHVADKDFAELLTNKKIFQKAGELDHLLKSGTGGVLHVPFPPGVASQLMEQMQFPLEPALEIGRAQVHGILEAVRDAILNWALRLQEQGVSGEDLDFSEKEKKTAAQKIFHVENYIEVNEMHDSQIQQGTSKSKQVYKKAVDWKEVVALIQELEKNAPALKLDKSELKQLLAQIATAKAQLDAPEPSGRIILELIKSARSILENAAGSVVATSLVTHSDKVIGLLKHFL